MGKAAFYAEEFYVRRDNVIQAPEMWSETYNRVNRHNGGEYLVH